MAISKFTPPKRTHLQTSSTINGRKWEAKKKLVRKRLADLKTTNRKEAIVPLGRQSYGPSSYYSRTNLANRVYASDEDRAYAIDRAQALQSGLESSLPSFVKPMLQSHVTGGFWLGLPMHFCAKHLPIHDKFIALLDEDDNKSQTKYLANKRGLSAGWRGFAIDHQLVDGDALVFQLIKPTVFKVYIVRANGLSEIDGAIGLMTLDACAHPMDVDQTEPGIEINEKEGEKSLEPLSLDIHQRDAQENKLLALSNEVETLAEQSRNESDDFACELLEGIRFSEASVDFKDIKSIDNFTIVVDGLVIDSEIPPHLRTKYYELCCSQNAFLHDNLLEGLNCKLVSGVISETVNIADAIRASKLSTSRDNFTTWQKTLKAFEKLGMNVGFLLGRLDLLLSLAFDSEKVLESKSVERVRAEEEMKTLEVKLLDVKMVMKNLDEEIEGLKGNKKTFEAMFQKEANATWSRIIVLE